MAILSTVEGYAHVEVESGGLNWHGYILLDPDPENIRYFDAFGPKSMTVYEGPVMGNGKYHFANGIVKITSVQYKEDPLEFRIDFKGIEKLNISKALESKPEDYLD